MLHTVKRKFRSVLRDVIEETVDDPELFEKELQHLRELLST